MDVFLILSSVFLALLVFGFLWGMFRSWKKSLIRFGLLVVDVVIAIFCSPLIAKAVLKKIAHGTTISIFNFSIDFSDFINDLVGSDLAGDLAAAEGVTNELATALLNVVMNIAIFFVFFIALWLFSLIIYAIICAIIKHAGKSDKKEKKHESIWLRLVGGVVGVVSMCVIFFALAIPVFGAMDICNNFVESEDHKKGHAYAAGLTNSLVCGRPYYKEDGTIGSIETYIEKYSEVKTQYDKSIVGGFCNAMGLSALGGKAFGYLTEVSSGDLKVNFSSEVVSIIHTYNAYKDTFVANSFDITNNESVDKLINVYDNITKSEIINRYVVELLPTMAEKWSNDESFLGIKNPMDNEFKSVVNKLLNVFKVKNSNRINANIRVMFNLIKVANENDFISTMTEGSGAEGNVIVDYFSGNKTLVKGIISTLSETEEFRNNLPAVFNEILRVFYDSMVGGENPIKDLTDDQVAQIDWNAEAENMQSVVNELMAFYGMLETPNVDLTEELGTVGRVIDFSRKSQMLSDSLQSFMVGYINSDKVDFGDPDRNVKIKTELISHINKRWSYKENPDFSFEVTFKAIAETAKVVADIAANAQDIDLNDFSNVLKDIVGNEASKDMILEIVDGALADELIGSSDSAVVVKDIFVDFIKNSSQQTIEKDIAAGEKIIEIVKSAENNNGQMNIDANNADAFVEAIAGSDNMMNILQKASEIEGDKLAGMTAGIDENSSNNIKASAEKAYEAGKISEEYKNTILNLFK